MSKSKKVRDVMSKDPVVLHSGSTVLDAARKMRQHNIGAVLVKNDEGAYAMLTDRDIVVRAVAEGVGPDATRIGDFCSRTLQTCRADDDLRKVMDAMRRHAIRRMPVMDGRQIVGMVSLGDLARRLDPDSVLGTISAAPPSRL